MLGEFSKINYVLRVSAHVTDDNRVIDNFFLAKNHGIGDVSFFSDPELSRERILR